METDSGYIKAYTDDFFREIKDYVDEWYDTSVYVDEETGWVHPAVKECGFPVGKNYKKAGLMADDSLKDFIIEFWGTASKEYCYKTENGKREKIKAKGIGRRTRNDVLSWKDFNDAIFNDKTGIEVEQIGIRSFNLKNYTIKMNKKIFTGDKRILLPNGINTLANGHWRDLGDVILPEGFPLPKKGTDERKWLEERREEYRQKLFPCIQGTE